MDVEGSPRSIIAIPRKLVSVPLLDLDVGGYAAERRTTSRLGEQRLGRRWSL